MKKIRKTQLKKSSTIAGEGKGGNLGKLCWGGRGKSCCSDGKGSNRPGLAGGNLDSEEGDLLQKR